MSGLTPGDNESPVRVVVTPSQSSYFAGEPFAVTITFTNTRSPEAGPSKPSAHAHKRGAHSISSAPLARPPTSPGTQRSAIAQSLLKTQTLADVPRRKGLIGKKKPTPLPLQSVGQLPDLIEQRRRRQLAPKALSVSLSPHELEKEVGEGVIGSSALYTQRSFFRDALHTPTSPLVSSPLARTDSLPLASNHPHARKQSVLDGQFSLDILSSTTSIPPAPYSPSSSASSSSLALDPIAEAALSPHSSTPALGSPTIEYLAFPSHTPTLSTNSPANVYAYPPPRNPNHRPAHLGLGQPPSSPRGYAHHIPRTAFATTFPQHQSNELILYSYAQLTGTVVITPVSGALSTPEQMRTLNAVRSALLKRSVRGGGSMDITSTLHSPLSSMPSKSPRHRTTHSRASSFSAAGFLSILSPTSLVSSISTPAPGSAISLTGSGWRSSSLMLGPSASSPASGGSTSSPNILGLGFPNGTGDEEIDPEEPLPTFEVQPAMLAVDLSLAPGESRSYAYTIKLPDNLPPTFKGKSLRFSYELVVGICRAGASGGGGVSANSISRVMKVPIRMYNHVVVGQALAPYDLLWPISKTIDAGMPEIKVKVVEDVSETQTRKNHLSMSSMTSPNPSLSTDDTLETLRSYAASLVATLPAKGKSRADSTDVHSSSCSVQSSDGTDSPSAACNVGNGEYKVSAEREELWRIERDREPADEGGLTGCREAVELLTRNPKKVSYDINKDGVKVAVLTFTKTAYRLGETVLGVVEVNERTSRARVLKLSAILESHESLPSSISPTSSARHLRRSHAEHHSSFTLNTLRTTFSFDIPSDASPAFQVGVGSSVPNPANLSTPSPLHPKSGGLEWKVRLCLLVSIAAETSYTGIQGVRFKSLVRDGPRGEWGSSWGATPGISPLEKPNLKAITAQRQQFQIISPRAWSQFLVSSILYGGADTDTEREYHDGDDIGDEDEDGENGLPSGPGGGDKEDYDGIIPDLAGGVGIGVDYANGDEGWQEVKLEMVECEVPVKVFPGNTAFKALDVIFDV